uniref:Integral membrane protein 2 n=1 Tax=Steinernema glaseri TaxID=37863 RepID=A0A1I7YYQ1_9BILA
MSGLSEPLTVLTVEQKNILADETNPNFVVIGPNLKQSSPCGNNRAPQKPNLPKSIITVLKNQIQQEQHRRLARVCLPILLIWILLASFFTGILFYKHFSRQPAYFGWCGTKFVENGRQERLTQRLEIDPEELYERIQVPRFGANRPAVFVHDFRKNITAIVDLLGKRCFIKSLDRNVVAPPKSFIDLVEKLEVR